MIRALIFASAIVLLAADPAPQWYGIDEPWEPGRIRIRGNIWQIAPASATTERVLRNDDGIPLALDPVRPFTATEMQRLRRETGCEDSVAPVYPGDVFNPQKIASDIRACLNGAAVPSAARPSFDRLRWLGGERW